MIYTVTLNPALDKTVEIPNFTLDAVNRITTLRTDPGGKGLNVSKVIVKLGGKSIAIGVLGGTTGRRIADAMVRWVLRLILLLQRVKPVPILKLSIVSATPTPI